jgi:hypothetical protein
MTQIFVSYAHRDTDLLEDFLRHLRTELRPLGATIWYDKKNRTGDHLDDGIAAAIEASSHYIFFVSASFLDSGYITDIERPAIEAARARSGGKILPVLAEQCGWKHDFGATVMAPITHRGILKPLNEWSPRSKGLGQAAVQVATAVRDHGGGIAPQPSDPNAPDGPAPIGAPPVIPDDEPGPRIGLVNGRFNLIEDPPSADEAGSPIQQTLHERLRERVDRLAAKIEGARNSHPALCREFDDYVTFLAAPLGTLNVTALISAGNSLDAMVAAFAAQDPARTMTDPLEPELAGLLNALITDHTTFVLGFEEGRELAARRAENRLYGEDLKSVRDKTVSVLEVFERQTGLFGDEAKKLIAGTSAALREGLWSARDLVETAAGLAVNGVIGVGRAVVPAVLDAAKTAGTYGGGVWVGSTLAGDPNMEAIRAALSMFANEGAQLMAVAAGHDVHRFIGWIRERSGVATNLSQDQRSDSESIKLLAVQKAIIYNESHKNQKNSYISTGSVIWRIDNETREDRSKNTRLRAYVQIEDPNLVFFIAIERNRNPSLRASHLIKIRITLRSTPNSESIENIPGIIMKMSESARGQPLDGVSHKISDNNFWIALSANQDRQLSNIQIIENNNWIDIPIQYKDGHRSILTLENSGKGKEIVIRALRAWDKEASLP